MADQVIYAVGDVILFAGYAELEAGQEEIFQADEEVTVTEVLNEDDPENLTYVIASADGERSDQAFSDEVKAKPAAGRTRARAAAPEAAPAPAPAKTAPKAAPKAAAAKAPAAAAKPAAAAPAAKPAAAKAAPAKVAGKAAPAASTVKTAAKPAGKAAASTVKGKNAAAAKPAPKGKAPAVQKPVEEEKIVIVDTEAVAAIMADQDALGAAKSLVDQAEQTFFTLGGVLAHIYYEGIYKTANDLNDQPYENFQGYVEGDLGMPYRRSMQLIDIYTKFSAANVDETVLSEVSWTKARELARAVTAENVEELLEFAANHTRDEVIEYVKTNYVDAKAGTGTAQPREKVARTSFKFSLIGDRGETVKVALAAAKERAGSEDDSEAFHLIVTEWAALTEAVETTLEEDIARLEAKHSVSFNMGGDEEPGA